MWVSGYRCEEGRGFAPEYCLELRDGWRFLLRCSELAQPKATEAAGLAAPSGDRLAMPRIPWKLSVHASYLNIWDRLVGKILH